MARDTTLLRRRLLTAMACFPISMSLSLAGCADHALDDRVYLGSDTAQVDTTRTDTSQTDTSVPDDTTQVDTTQVDTAQPDTAQPDATGMLCEEGYVVIDDSFCGYGTWTMTFGEAAERAGERPGNCPEYFETESPESNPEYPWVWLEINREAPDNCVNDAGQPLCVYNWYYQCPGGRVLVADGGGHVLAETRPGKTWSTDLDDDGGFIRALPEHLRQRIASAWLEDARVEHASVASFARVTLELMRFGGPPELLASIQQAAMDEVQHAQACFALASRYCGSPIEAGRLDSPPPREVSLATFAVDTLIEGCIGESIATLAATRALASCRVPVARQTLDIIVQDETQHAALAWATVRWAVEVGGDTVRDALREAADRLRPRPEVPPSADPHRAALAFHGRLDAAAQHVACEDAWRGVIDPMLVDLLA